MRRPNSRANDSGRFPHFFPDPNRRSIHIKQPYLLATLSPETIDTDCPQETCLPGLEQVRSHADGRRILDVLHVLGALRNDLVVQSCRGVLRDEASQKSFDVRPESILPDAHSAARIENQ